MQRSPAKNGAFLRSQDGGARSVAGMTMQVLDENPLNLGHKNIDLEVEIWNVYEGF